MPRILKGFHLGMALVTVLCLERDIVRSIGIERRVGVNQIESLAAARVPRPLRARSKLPYENKGRCTALSGRLPGC
jgi:hypothetical protein